MAGKRGERLSRRNRAEAEAAAGSSSSSSSSSTSAGRTSGSTRIMSSVGSTLSSTNRSSSSGSNGGDSSGSNGGDSSGSSRSDDDHIDVCFLALGKSSQIDYSTTIIRNIEAQSPRRSRMRYHLLVDQPTQALREAMHTRRKWRGVPKRRVFLHTIASISTAARTLYRQLSRTATGPGPIYLYKPLLHLVLPTWIQRVLVLDTDLFLFSDIAGLWAEFDRFAPAAPGRCRRAMPVLSGGTRARRRWAQRWRAAAAPTKDACVCALRSADTRLHGAADEAPDEARWHRLARRPDAVLVDERQRDGRAGGLPFDTVRLEPPDRHAYGRLEGLLGAARMCDAVPLAARQLCWAQALHGKPQGGSHRCVMPRRHRTVQEDRQGVPAGHSRCEDAGCGRAHLLQVLMDKQRVAPSLDREEHDRLARRRGRK